MSASAEARWQRLSELFDDIVELDSAERAARLAELATQDADLAVELAQLLQADADASGVLDRGVKALAPTMVDALAQSHATAAADTEAPASIGRFRLIRLLGRGGMGEVYLAESTQGDFVQQVALKLLKRGMDSDDILRRFSQERRILAQLNHAHIARLVDGGISAEGRPYYAMEYVDGMPLTEYARAHALDVRERVQLMSVVCDAVAHAQTRLVVHRDLKPSNILVDSDGQPRVLDFGIAKILSDSEEQGLTRTGARALSPAYAAPEQVSGEAISTATDVYALGIVLYEMLSGRLPHRRVGQAREGEIDSIERPSQALRRADETTTTLSYGTRRGERERLARSIAGDLDTIVLTALKREPERRYATASALAADLRRWLDGRTVSARPDSAAYRTRRFVRRHRVGVAASLLVLLSLLAGLGAALWQAAIARAAGVAAAEQAAIATAVSEFLTEDVIRAANPYRSKLDLRLTDALKQASGTVAQRFAAQPRTEGVVRRTLAESLRLAGESDAAIEQARLALKVLGERFGEADADALKARAVLGRVLAQAEREAESYEVYSKGLEYVSASPRDPARLRFLIGIAGIHVEDRHEDKALPILQMIEADVEATFGTWSDERIDLLGHRMRAYAHTDRYAETLVVARTVLAGAQQRFGMDDPRTLEWMQREAIALRLLDRFEDALVAADKVLRVSRERLGENHPATMDAHLQKGIILIELKRFAEAAADIDAAVAFNATQNGRIEYRLLTQVWQARQRQYSGKTAEARAMFEAIYAQARAELGEDNPNTPPYGQTLGMFLMNNGDRAAAEVLQRQLIAKVEQLTPGHVNVAKNAFDLVENLAAQPERAADTLALLQEWLPRWQKSFGESDSRVVDAKRWLAEAQARLQAPR